MKKQGRNNLAADDRWLAGASKKIERFVSGYVAKSRAGGVVVGLSGGLDSSVVLKLCVNALGPAKVLGLVMPSSATPREDVEDAVELAEALKIEYQKIDLGPIIEKYAEVLPGDKMAKGNLAARVRMNLLYYYAAVKGFLVAGTSDKSELHIGYFTKFGDGAADLLPIADLYKTQVRALARFLGIPAKIVEKKSSPRLWDEHLAEEELGISYEALDPILFLLVDRKMTARDAARKLGVPAKQAGRVRGMVDKSRHKRSPAAIARLR